MFRYIELDSLEQLQLHITINSTYVLFSYYNNSPKHFQFIMKYCELFQF